MKLYFATGEKSFKIVEEENVTTEDVKLKVGLIYPARADVALYEGKIGAAYPRVPCGMATAVVSEDRPEYGLKRGARVILNPYVNPSSQSENYVEPLKYGYDKDGFLRDFISVPMDNVIPFPEDIKEEEAVFADMVAVALKVINTFEIKKGDYIALVGGTLLNNVIGQLALYYQAVPIYISKDEELISLAQKCGIYYTINEEEEDVAKRVLTVTGGRMADHTVIGAKHGVTASFMYNLTARGGDCIIAALSDKFLPRLDCDVSVIAGKNLSIKGVSCGKSEFNSAVNTLAQKILKFDGFIEKTYPLSDAELVFKTLAEEYEVGGHVGVVFRA